jgi:Ribbon-helix-helix protein, copG family
MSLAAFDLGGGTWMQPRREQVTDTQRGGEQVRTKDHTGSGRIENGRFSAAAGGGDHPAESSPPDRLVRLSVNLGPEVADSLKDYAARKGISVTEAIRRAIGLLAFIDEAQARGAALNIEEKGTVKEVVFLV